MKKNQFPKLWLAFFVIGFILGVISTQAATMPYIKINGNSSATKIRKVTLTLEGPADTRQMKVSNDIGFSGAKWESFKNSIDWYLDYGNGTKTVYVKFKDKKNQVSDIFKDTILLNAPSSMTVDFKINQPDEKKASATTTGERYVQLFLKWSDGVEKFRVSNSNDFSEFEYLWMDSSFSWVLTPDSGEKTVYVEFKDANGSTKVISQKITYNEPKHYIPEGSLLKGQFSTIYYLGFDGKIHPFWGGSIYHSWYSDFSGIKYVSNLKLSEYKLGNPVCVKPGTWLVKFKGLPDVFSVEPGCRLRLIRSEGEAMILYGPGWSGRVIDLDLVLKSYYTITYSEVTAIGTDKDKDGIGKDEEANYGTSDNNKDTDSDGLSDYEELFYWFSDPSDPDTDDDGYNDGLEVLSGYSPIGSKKITAVDEGTYTYPEGTVLLKGDTYYYVGSGGVYRYIAKKTSDINFTSNNFQTKFIIKPLVDIPFDYSSKNRVGKAEEKLFRPQVRTSKGNLTNL